MSTVVAPAGWGKTTLLASWARSGATRPGSVGWFSIDEGDDEPVRFWTYALSALATVAPEIAGDALAALGCTGPGSAGCRARRAAQSLAATADRKVLVLDDYHLLSDPAIHESLEFVLGYLPPSLHVVIAGRADPPLPLARMRARGTLTEIRVDDLRCTADEASQLVSAVADVTPAAANGLAQRTEGWPAGLQLAALTLRGSADPDATSATHPRRPPAHPGLLRHRGADRSRRRPARPAGALFGFRAAIRVAVRRRAGNIRLGNGSGDDWTASDLFVTALGEGWYRCHRLFRDVLRRELDASGSRLEPAAADPRR